MQAVAKRGKVGTEAGASTPQAQESVSPASSTLPDPQRASSTMVHDTTRLQLQMGFSEQNISYASPC